MVLNLKFYPLGSALPMPAMHRAEGLYTDDALREAYNLLTFRIWLHVYRMFRNLKYNVGKIRSTPVRITKLV